MRGQRSHKNTCTKKIKESTIEIFNFVVCKSMNGAKITELAALRPLRGLRLTSYSSFNFRHLWLHFTYCSNMRSSYSRYILSSLAYTGAFSLSFTLYLEIVLSIKSTNQKHGGFDVTVSLFSWGHPLTTAHA